MTDTRLHHLPVEVLVEATDPDARVGHVSAEALVVPDPDARVGHVSAEALVTLNPDALVGHLSAEVLIKNRVVAGRLVADRVLNPARAPAWTVIDRRLERESVLRSASMGEAVGPFTRLHDVVMATNPSIYVPGDVAFSSGGLERSDLATPGGALVPSGAGLVDDGGAGGFDRHLVMAGEPWTLNSASLSKVKSALAFASAFSAAIWWRTNETSSSDPDYMLRLGNLGIGLYYRPSDGALFGFYYDSGGVLRLSAGSVVTNRTEVGGGWQFAMIRKTPGVTLSLEVWRNGNRANANSPGGTGVLNGQAAATHLTVGADGTAGNHWNGGLAQLAIWNRAITADELHAIYMAGLGALEERAPRVRRPVAHRPRLDHIPLIASPDDPTPQVEFITSSVDGELDPVAGTLGVAGGQIVLAGKTIRLVDRVGDSFTLSAPDALPSTTGFTVFDAAFVGPDIVVHSHDNATSGQIWDVDPTGPTISGPSNPFSSLTPSHVGYRGYPGGSQQKLVTLDNEHFAIVGHLGQAAGFQPFLFLAERDGVSWQTFGPFPFGDVAMQGGYEPSGFDDMTLLRLDETRLLATWRSRFTATGTPERVQSSRGPGYAQVLAYDLVTNEITPAGPVAKFTSNLENGLHAIWDPVGSAVLLTGSTYDVDFPGGVRTERHEVVARTLLVDGTTVAEGSSRVVVAGHPPSPAPDYDWSFNFYGYAVVGTAGQFMIAYPRVHADEGGDIRFVRFQLGSTGAGRGAIKILDDGVLFEGDKDAGTDTDHEMWQVSQGVDVGSGESLALFEHYLDDYAATSYKFLLAKEIAP